MKRRINEKRHDDDSKSGGNDLGKHLEMVRLRTLKIREFVSARSVQISICELLLER